ncbi:hypothetical protein niasHS_003377 [Heterodera schachtii]|uniref:Uncharacterized protein n=1 Tax=Heterodera schachtii TaxID=97005 RepID=A0ABD2KGH5_HETSC
MDPWRDQPTKASCPNAPGPQRSSRPFLVQRRPLSRAPLLGNAIPGGTGAISQTFPGTEAQATESAFWWFLTVIFQPSHAQQVKSGDGVGRLSEPQNSLSEVTGHCSEESPWTSGRKGPRPNGAQSDTQNPKRGPWATERATMPPGEEPGRFRKGSADVRRSAK